MLERLISRSATLDRSHFYFADLSTPDLLQQLSEKNVKAVYALGDPVLQQLTGEKDILRWRGRALEWHGRWLIPGLAPHDLLPKRLTEEEKAKLKFRGITPLVSPPRFQGVWMLDAALAIDVAQNGFTRSKAVYTVDPTPQEFNAWTDAYFAALAADADTHLSWDIETVYKQKRKNEDEFEEAEFDHLENGTLLRISFSYATNTGVSVPWDPAYLPAIHRLLAGDGPKIVWNGRAFDVPVVEAAGLTVGGEVFDYMDAFHVYQSDLPKGLEFVTSFTSDLLPWKHLNNADPGLYSAIDADAAFRNAMWIREQLKRKGQWELYYYLFHKAMDPLAAASKRGNFIDIAKRDQLKAELTALIAGLDAEMQPLVPREVKPRKVWLNPPVEGWPKLSLELDAPVTQLSLNGRDFDQQPVPQKVKMCSACGLIASNKTEHFKGSKEPKLDLFGEQLVDKKTGKPKFTQVKNPCKVAGGEIVEVPGIHFEYHEVLDFNPGSTEQVKAYARFHGHPIGVDARDSTKESMDKTHLKALIKKYGDKHPIYEKIAERSKLAKTLGTYIYEPDANGLIHQTYKNAPSTPRLSGANYNLMNVGKRADNPWTVKAREQIIARPGHRFVQADSSAIEAVIQGYRMGDKLYMDLATQSIHAWVVARMHRIPWTGSSEQVEMIKSRYKADYDKMKTVNYLTLFGGGPYLMWKTDPKSFPTKESAEQAQAMLFAQLPKLKEYHQRIRQRAQKDGYIELMQWKFRHYYFDVFNRDQYGNLKLGKDSKRVVSLEPQGYAALFLRENTLLLAYGDEAAEWLGIEPLGLKRGYIDYMPANFAVHDGLTMEVPDGMEDEVMDALEKVLTRPIKFLEGLRIGCEIDVSPVNGNWGTYHPEKNPMGLKTVKTVRVPALPDGHWLLQAEAA